MAVCEKRSLEETVHSAKNVLLDIEGTTTSISFVKETLFPYVRKSLESYVSANWEKDEFKEVLSLLREQATKDVDSKVEGAVSIPSEGSADEQQAAVVSNVLWQMDNDRKTTALKQLQGLVWRLGYKDGELKGHVYPDVAPALRRWTENGRKLYVYSSGSVEAQKLLFKYSQDGDLSELFSGHFDTTVGPKVEADSYKAIVKSLDCNPDNLIFLTDVPKEASAAREAGLPVVLVTREDAKELTADEKADFSSVTTLEDVVFSSTVKKQKVDEAEAGKNGVSQEAEKMEVEEEKETPKTESAEKEEPKTEVSEKMEQEVKETAPEEKEASKGTEKMDDESETKSVEEKKEGVDVAKPVETSKTEEKAEEKSKETPVEKVEKSESVPSEEKTEKEEKADKEAAPVTKKTEETKTEVSDVTEKVAEVKKAEVEAKAEVKSEEKADEKTVEKAEEAVEKVEEKEVEKGVEAKEETVSEEKEETPVVAEVEKKETVVKGDEKDVKEAEKDVKEDDKKEEVVKEEEKSVTKEVEKEEVTEKVTEKVPEKEVAEKETEKEVEKEKVPEKEVADSKKEETVEAKAPKVNGVENGQTNGVSNGKSDENGVNGKEAHTEEVVVKKAAVETPADKEVAAEA